MRPYIALVSLVAFATCPSSFAMEQESTPAEKLYVTWVEPFMHREMVEDFASEVVQSLLTGSDAKKFLELRGITECPALDEVGRKFAKDDVRPILEEAFISSGVRENSVALIARSFSASEIQGMLVTLETLGAAEVLWAGQKNPVFLNGMGQIFTSFANKAFGSQEQQVKYMGLIDKKLRPALSMCKSD